MIQKMLPRDLRPGMKIARINAKIEVEYVEVGRIDPVRLNKAIGAYKIYPTRWLNGEQAMISRSKDLRYLAPFTVTNRQKLEVKL